MENWLIENWIETKEYKYKYSCTTKSTSKQSKGTAFKIGMWNIRRITRKEEKPLEEFERADLALLAVTETKKKGQWLIELEKVQVLIHSELKLK